jgi:hypothetical protein
MKTITTHTELIELFNEDTTHELHLHMERDCGTHSIPFHISTQGQKVAEGVMDTTTDADGEYINELAWAVLDDCYDGFSTVTEYDSLVAATNPGIRKA